MTTLQVSPTTLGLEAAERAIAPGRGRAEELGVPMNIAVLDGGARGRCAGAVETSAVKARTAVLFAQPTRDLAAAVGAGAPLFTTEAATREPLAACR